MATAEEPQIPKSHRAAVYDKPGSISTAVKDVSTPEPGFGEVLVRLTHTGVCASDLAIMLNGWKTLPYPTMPDQVGGHEGVGKVVKLGPGADKSGVKIGDRVGIKWVSATCNTCAACLAGKDAVCFNQKISGYYTPGTFQEYAVGPAHYVTPIPDSLDSAAAAPLLCAGVTVYSALRESGTESGDWVVLLGAGGGLGHIATQLAARGFGLRVIGVDDSSKESFVKESGAEVFVPLDAKSIPDAVKEATGGMGAHAVLNLTSSNEAYASAIEMLRFGGRLVCVGLPNGEPAAIGGATPGIMVAKALSVVGVAVGDRKRAIEVLDFAARGIVKSHYRTEKLENLTEVFQQMKDGKLSGRVVIDLQ